MSLLRETYYIYLRNVRVWLSHPLNVASPIMFVVFFFLVFGTPLSSVTLLPGFPADDYKAFLTGMILVQAVVFSGSDTGFAMLTDILSGYFEKLLLSPVHRFSILLASLLTAGTRALMQALVIVALALVLGVSFKGGVLGIIAVILMSCVFGIAWSSLGLMIALKTKNVQVTESTWLLFFPLVFMTTAFMPKEFLSGWFRVAVSVNPVNYVLEGIRVIVVEGWKWDVILPGLWVLVGMTVVLTSAAAWFYRRATG